MNSMLKLQVAYEEAKKALKDREKVFETVKKTNGTAKRATEQPFDKIAQISDLLQTYLLESQVATPQ